MKRINAGAMALAAVLVLAAALAWLASRSPAPVGPDAAPTVFSAGRAMVDDRAMAARPHPIGSAEAGLVRSYILSRMQSLGLTPRTAPGEAVETPRWFKGQVVVGARVENLVGVLKGTDSTLPAVLLMAHSDSVPGSPGAADDAAGVVSILEVVRALKAEGPLRRDVAVLITDGEEAGLLGARAFFASDDPLLKHVGEVVNLEARGGGGRVAMFQMGEKDGGHMGLFSRAVGDTNANSLTSEVYKYMPNDTDFTVSRAAGYPGFNFAFVGKEFDYHSPSSTPAVLDQGSLQHMGNQALAITRALANAPALPAKGADAAYSDLLGHGVIAYPAVLGGWILTILAFGVAIVSARRGQRLEGDRELRMGPMVWGFGGAFLIVLVTGLVLWVASQFVGLRSFLGHRAFLAQYTTEFGGFILLTLGALLFLVGPVQRSRAWTALVGLNETRWSAWLGVFLLVGVVGIGLQFAFPPMAMLTLWPLLIAAAAMAGIAFAGEGRFETRPSLIIAAAAGLIGAAHLGHFADETFSAVGEMAPALLALFVLLSLPVLFPLLTAWGRVGGAAQLTSLGVMGLGAVTLIYAALHDPASARTPTPVEALFLQDSVTGKSWRASGMEKLDSWSASAIGAPALTPVRQRVEALNANYWLTPAPSGAEQRPAITSTRDGQAVVVHLAPQAGGRELRLTLSTSTPVKAMTIDAMPTALLAKPGALYYVRWSAPADGLSLRFVPSAPGELHLLYAEIKDGWPVGLTPPPKPANRMPWALSDVTVVQDELKTRW